MEEKDMNFEQDEVVEETTAIEPVEPISMDEVNTKKQKNRDRMVFGGGILAGIAAAWLYATKVRPSLKKARAERKAEKAMKKALKEGQSIPYEEQKPNENEG